MDETGESVGLGAGAGGEAAVGVLYALELDDLIHATIAVNDMDPAFRKTRRMVQIVLPAGLLGAAVVAYWISDLILAVSLLIVGIATLLFARRALNSGIADKLRKQASQGQLRDIGNEREAAVDASGVTFKTPDSASRIAWKTFARIVQTQECLFFYTGPQLAVFVPKRCVRTGLYDDFVAAVGRHATVEKVAKGTTFRSVRADIERERARARRGRAAKAFFWGMFWAVVVATFGTTYLERHLPAHVSTQVIAMLATVAAAGVGIFAAVWRATALTQKDRETRCRRCEYVLKGLVEPRCPECGERV